MAEPPMHRYNRALPPVYRHRVRAETNLLHKALVTLAESVWNGQSSDDEANSVESYELECERLLSALEKGVTRAQELKYAFLPNEYPIFVNTFLRAALTPSLDPGLRSKCARACTRLLVKDECKLPNGIQWRAVVNAILRDHVECVHGAPFWGRDVRDSHCRNLVNLLEYCKFYLPENDSAKTIWNAFVDKIRLYDDDPDTAFLSFFLFTYLIPYGGDEWTGWVEEGIQLWQSVENCSLWDAHWLSLFAKVAEHQPGVVNWDGLMPRIFKRLSLGMQLPLGSVAPHSPTKRFVPPNTYFLLHSDVILSVAVFAAYTLSPTNPVARTYLERIIVLIENYCHPSNTGRWSGFIAVFVSTFTSKLTHRVTKERAATKAGVMGRVLSDSTTYAVAPMEYRLTDAYVDEIVNLFLPLLKLGINSKSSGMARQACSAARDLSIISRHLVVPPMLEFAQEGLLYVQSPHRTSAALRLLASLSPIFLDPEMYPEGAHVLTELLELILPGIDINDTSKTDGSLRVLATVAARLRGLIEADTIPGLVPFLEDYVPRLLDRIFTLFSSLEAPPKKNRNGSFPQTNPQVSILLLTVTFENLFAALPQSVVVSAAKRISRQISGSASTNAMKQYGILVRCMASAASLGVNADGISPAADLFLPSLLNQVLDDSVTSDGSKVAVFSSLSKEELVWRIRMLAQACRCVGKGMGAHMDRLTNVIQLSFEREERPVYKAGGRLLRGILEGLTSIQVSTYSPAKDPEPNEDGDIEHDVQWRIPSADDWQTALKLVRKFFGLAEKMVYGSDDASAKRSVLVNREVLFRALRLLHAVQRGARWLLGGSTSDSYDGLEKFEAADDVKMTKDEAFRAVRRPISAGLYGEIDAESRRDAKELWERVYELISEILTAAVAERPDDGILLYRCLEPIEVAGEPFKRAGSGKIHDSGSSLYKSIYRSILALKRPHFAVGGAGRAMPHFIFRLRIAGLHDTRLAYAARPGSASLPLIKKIANQVGEYTLNDFHRVRAEARGVYTRALRVTSAGVRRNAVLKLVNVLSETSTAARKAQKDRLSRSLSNSRTEQTLNSSGAIKNGKMSAEARSVPNGTNPSKSEIHYEKMIGACSVLRSSVVAPMIMRSVSLYDKVVRSMVESLLAAERPDAAIATGQLFFRLLNSARPLTLEPVRFVELDLTTLPTSVEATAAETPWTKRRKILDDLNSFLLGLVQKSSASDVASKQGEKLDAHWRLQSLVASLLLFNIRADKAPSFEVTNFFGKGLISDVVSLRQISCKALALILALHGKKPKPRLIPCDGLPTSERKDPIFMNDALRAIDELIGGKDFVRKMIHTLALDHESSDGTGGRRQMSRTPGGYQSMLSLIGHSDDYTSWVVHGGESWPKSHVPRFADNIVLSRVRLYESLLQVFGGKAFEAFVGPTQEIVEKIANEEKGIIDGVKDEDVRIFIAEVIAGVCRGLPVEQISDDSKSVDTATDWVQKILESLTGPQGVINGATIIRLVNTAESGTMGTLVAEKMFDWLLSKKPLIAAAESGTVAQMQARHLRYIHGMFADIPKQNSKIECILKETMKELMSTSGFGHELKAVREEVSRLLSLVILYSDRDASFDDNVEELIQSMATSRTESGGDNLSENNVRISTDEDGDEEDSAENVAKKLRSRLGETLSRLTQRVGDNSRALQFQKHFVRFLPSIFVSLDDHDKTRCSHARLALSLAAQRNFDDEHLEKIVSLTEETVKSPIWKIRGGALPFLQVLLFMFQFTAPTSVLDRMRAVVVNLVSDTQIEVRQAAAVTLVPIIRDAPPEEVVKVRETFMKVIKDTQPPRRRAGSRREPMPADVIRKRHGAALGLSSLVISSPYSVPAWMPPILVALSNCVNDPPPISTSVKVLFVDFMRTHRDEWQTHKRAFTEEELEIVQELLVSPSYYA